MIFAPTLTRPLPGERAHWRPEISTPPLHGLARVALRTTRAPLALVSRIEGGWEEWIGHAGCAPAWVRQGGVDLSRSLCEMVVARAEPLILRDGRRHPRFRRHYAVDALGVRAYAGFPLRGSGGEVIGTFCVFDSLPHDWTRDQLESVHSLAAAANGEILLRATEQRVRREAEWHTRLQRLIEGTGVVLWEVDYSTGQITFVSPEVSALLGYPPQAWHADPGLWQRVVHPEDRSRVPSLRALDTRQEMEFRVLTADGEERWVRHTGRVVTGGRRVAAWVDITRHKQVESRKEAAATWFRSLVEHSLIGIYIIHGGRFVYVNPRLAEIFGYPPEEMITDIQVQDLVAPEDRKRVVELSRRRDVEEKNRHYTFTGLRKDATTLHLEVRDTLARVQGRTVLIGTLLDVTERERAEEALRTRKAYLERLFESAPEGVVLLDDGDRVIRANSEFLRMFGYEKEEVLGRSINDLIVPDEYRDEARSLTEGVALGERIATETVRCRKDGSLLHVSILGTPVEAGDGRTPVYALYRDITERKALEEESARLYHEAQEAVRAREEVLAVVSHDLRNPLSAISMGTTLLLEAASGESKAVRQSLRVIQRATEQMNILIQDLLDVSRMEAGSFAVRTAPIAATRLLEDAYRQLQTLGEESGVELSCEIPKDLGSVEADRDRVMRVFSNLVGNAIKFTPRGGRVTLGAEAVEEGVRFFVSDTGPGIPPEHLPHLFDRFWQAEKGTGHGAGLGLAIAKGIVEAHDGGIGVESTPGKGSTFWFTLPSTTP